MYLLRGDSILLDKVRDQVVNPLSLFLHGQCLVNMHSLPKHVGERGIHKQVVNNVV